MRTVCWRLSTWNPDIASVRCRAAIPALHLAIRGVESRFSAGPYDVLRPTRPDALVFVKAFGERDLQHAEEAARARIPILVDVCDNVFAPGYRPQPGENLRRMAKLAAAVVTTGPALAEVLREELGDDVPVHIVPDPVETPGDVRDASHLLWQQRLGEALRERRTDLPLALGCVGRHELLPMFRRYLPQPRVADLPQVLWFGNVGSINPRFGILNLTDIATELVAAAREVPFRLLVVTGDRAAYRRHIEPLGLDAAFSRWERQTIFRRVHESAAVIVPNSRDEFSICKSANRSVLALSQGAPVVATRIPSLDAFEEAMLFDDFRTGLLTYLTDPSLAAEHVCRAGEIIEREFAPATVAEKWLSVFDAVLSTDDRAGRRN
jgi:glycosyltransferase involved in cell wall biosynthesis